ncbi:hypothetical protein E8A74_25435 [Polyangium fumosum]|uniref:Lipoprotein n=1 Tax=Polyangium fumosum TaxID=889272 RepID=A0A4U1J829_9BACT|nr:hypothetical protein E8A74_25435 [Polyangium fumosum]
MDHALRSGFGMALLAALALANGCAPVEGALEGEGEDSIEPSSEEAADELQTRASVRAFRCTLSGGLVSASMVVYPGPQGKSTCTIVAPTLARSSQRYCTGTGIFMTCPDCQDLRVDLSCPYRARNRTRNR